MILLYIGLMVAGIWFSRSYFDIFLIDSWIVDWAQHHAMLLYFGHYVYLIFLSWCHKPNNVVVVINTITHEMHCCVQSTKSTPQDAYRAGLASCPTVYTTTISSICVILVVQSLAGLINHNVGHTSSWLAYPIWNAHMGQYLVSLVMQSIIIN